MTYCFIYCSGCQDFHKTNQLRIRALDMYYFVPFPIVIKGSGSKSLPTSNPICFSAETGDFFYIIRMLPDCEILDLCATTTTSQNLSLVFRQA